MRASLVRTDLRRTMEASSLMGEITFIKDGYSSVIHDDGTITTTALSLCDNCEEWVVQSGGMNYRLQDGELVIWLCDKCRK